MLYTVKQIFHITSPGYTYISTILPIKEWNAWLSPQYWYYTHQFLEILAYSFLLLISEKKNVKTESLDFAQKPRFTMVTKPS